MDSIESALEVILPPRSGPLQPRFDGIEHPVIHQLNLTLDDHGRYHGEPSWSLSGGTEYHPIIAGDPYLLSKDVIDSAARLADEDYPDLAVRIMDQASNWPGTAVHADDYVDIAERAARIGKVNTALAISLANDRILFREPYTHVHEIPEDDERICNLLNLASTWLCNATVIYSRVMKSKDDPNEHLARMLLSKIDLYSSVVARQCQEGGLPPQPEVDVVSRPWIETLRYARVSLDGATEHERAGYIAGLDPAIAKPAEL